MTRIWRSVPRGQRVAIVVISGLIFAAVAFMLVVSFINLWNAAAQDGVPVWLWIIWLAVILAILGYSLRMPAVPGTPKAIAARLRAQGTEQGKKIGHAVGWVLVVSTIGFMLALVFVPIGASLVAFATWSKDRRDACSADPSCVISTIPENALPVWVAFAWIAIVLVALLVTWKPTRWWLPGEEARRHVRVRVFTTPFWIRVHALVAAFVSYLCALGVMKRGNDVYAVEYVWAMLAALTVAALATVCKRQYGMKTPLDVKMSLALTASAPYGVLDRRWRAAQRQLHPRGRTKGATDDN